MVDAGPAMVDGSPLRMRVTGGLRLAAMRDNSEAARRQAGLAPTATGGDLGYLFTGELDHALETALALMYRISVPCARAYSQSSRPADWIATFIWVQTSRSLFVGYIEPNNTGGCRATAEVAGLLGRNLLVCAVCTCPAVLGDGGFVAPLW